MSERESTTDRVPVCPNCESVSVREKRSDPRNGSRGSKNDWYCHKCNSHFETPDEKPRSETDSRPNNPGSSDLVQRLLDADADEVGQPMTDGGEEIITVCPNCDSARIVRRTRSNLRKRWRCKGCEARFDEANRRERRGHKVSTHGPGRALQDADPDDWPPASDDVDRGEGVETDGGTKEFVSLPDEEGVLVVGDAAFHMDYGPLGLRRIFQAEESTTAQFSIQRAHDDILVNFTEEEIAELWGEQVVAPDTHFRRSGHYYTNGEDNSDAKSDGLDRGDGVVTDGGRNVCADSNNALAAYRQLVTETENEEVVALDLFARTLENTGSVHQAAGAIHLAFWGDWFHQVGRNYVTSEVGDGPTCTAEECDQSAVFAYETEYDFARARSVDRDGLEDEELFPHVCQHCRDRLVAERGFDADRFVRPETRNVCPGCGTDLHRPGDDSAAAKQCTQCGWAEADAPDTTTEQDTASSNTSDAVASERPVADGGTASPIREIDSAVVWYHEDAGRVKHEGGADIYPNWVRFSGPMTQWIPRERVEGVMRK